MTEQRDEEQIYDLIIAGAGFSGSLFAARFAFTHPKAKILILDKNNSAGGRVSLCSAKQELGFAFNAISKELLEFVSNTLTAINEGSDKNIETIVNLKQDSQVGLFAAGELTLIDKDEFYSTKGISLSGGKASLKDLKLLDDYLVPELRVGQGTFSKAIKLAKKGNLATALARWASFLGVSDIAQAEPVSLLQRMDFYQNSVRSDWSALFTELLAAIDPVSFVPSSYIVDSSYENNIWSVNTSQGCFKAKSLLVAQDPWESMKWLPVKEVPVPFRVLSMKTQAVSSLVLTARYEGEIPLPQESFVLAEATRVICSGSTLYFQTTLDYEQSLDAPQVVKALRRLKRSKEKLTPKYLSKLKYLGEHVGLLPVAWAQSTAAAERKILVKMKPEEINKGHLSFCGDAYGGEYHPDQNLINSLLGASTSVSSVLD